MNLTIRKASEKDSSQIVGLINSAYRGEASKVGWTTEADLVDGERITNEGLIEILHRPKSYILVVEDQQEIVGSVHCQIENGETFYFGMLAVRPKLQASGIGKLLLRRVETEAQEHRCRRIRLTVINHRPEVIAYYQRQGFVLNGLEHAFPLPDLVKVEGIKLLEMEKHL